MLHDLRTLTCRWTVTVLTAGRRCRRGRLGVDSQFKLLVEHVAGGRRYQPIFCAVRTNKRLSIMTSKKAKSSAETTKALRAH